MNNAEPLFTLTGFPALIFMIVLALIWVVPMWKLLPKFGFSKWLSCLGFIPILGAFAVLVLIWVIAFSDTVSTRDEGTTA